MSVLLRSEKGSPLTHTEMDNNLAAIRAAEALLAALGTLASQDANNVAISGGTIGGVPVASIALGGTAAGIVFVPTGNINATDVQAAIAELDTEKAAIGHTHTGTYQPASANLDEYAAVNPTTAGLALLDDADAAAQRTTLGLGNAAVATIGVGVQAYDANTAKLNVNQNFTVAQRGTPIQDNDLSFDLNVANNFLCVPTAGGTLTFTNITAGQSGTIILSNNSNYTIAKAATTKCDSSFLTTISTSGIYRISYYSDGASVYCSTTGALS